MRREERDLKKYRKVEKVGRGCGRKVAKDGEKMQRGNGRGGGRVRKNRRDGETRSVEEQREE